LHEQFDLVFVADETRRPAGLSVAVVVSLVVHALLISLFLTAYDAAPPAAADVPIARYVQLIQQQPQQFVEAPGPEVASAPLTAPLSDKNRRASIPEPTGDQPTNRPGDGRDVYVPPMGSGGSDRPMQRAQAAQEAQQPRAASFGTGERPSPATDTSTFTFREPAETSAASAVVDWRQAIRQVKPSTGGSGSGFDTSGVQGGERGTAEQGPLSFETQWFDWGPYAQSMVSRIRVNWYANMPQLIRTGIAGVVDVTVLDSSGHPPYDFAARKAIELSSPLNPLPADFPNPNERVTAKFFYNKPIG
jgi:outer membrane biosynthesis protein TonB